MNQQTPRSCTRFLSLSAGWLCCLLALACASCGTLDGPASASFASATIQGRSTEEIANVTAQVFREAGYAGGPARSGQMVFEKEGSRMDNLAYEGVVATHYGAQTFVRVKADIVSLEGDSHRLQCQAYMVRGAGDAFFAEEQRLAHSRRGPYQSLLNKVAERLK